MCPQGQEAFTEPSEEEFQAIQARMMGKAGAKAKGKAGKKGGLAGGRVCGLQLHCSGLHAKG